MREQHLAQTIAFLRKKHGVTQEQLGEALHISPQAISKWENGACLPDTQTLPKIAEYFRVSVDYLFYGSNSVYEDIYPAVEQKTASYRPMMSAESYEEALKIFAAAHHGITYGNLHRGELLTNDAAHISSEGGVSLLGGMGYGALITRRFFETICPETIQVAVPLMQVLADEKRLRVVMAIVSMSDISFFELRDKVGLPDDELSAALRPLLDARIVNEKMSKHQSLGKTYEIDEFYHTCICILLATLEMQRLTLQGRYRRCAGYGDFPIDLKNGDS